MENKYFTAFDGTVYITKSHIKKVITETLKEKQFSCEYKCKRITDAILKKLDDCYYKEQIPEITNPDVDYFYCGGCRRGFPVKYTKEMMRTDYMPCPRCGATAYLSEVETNEKDNSEGS